jgi:hypothetical protein
MNQPLPHVAFRASENLHIRTQEYIDLMSRAGARPNPALLAEVMDHFTSDSLNAFMLRPMEELGISGTQRRLVEFAADTVQKSSQVVLKATVNKLDHDQHRKSAAFMDEMRLLLPEEDENHAWFVSFRAPDHFAERARASMARARQQGPQAELRETIIVMKTLTDLALENYYERPLAILRFGPILRKVSEVAISTVRKGTHSTIENLLPKLTEDQLLKGIEYFDALLIDVEQQHLRAVPRAG